MGNGYIQNTYYIANNTISYNITRLTSYVQMNSKIILYFSTRTGKVSVMVIKINIKLDKLLAITFLYVQQMNMLKGWQIVVLLFYIIILLT